MISGTGLPRAAHSTTAPVVLEKSTLLGGSLIKTGPAVSSSAITGTDRDILIMSLPLSSYTIKQALSKVPGG
jgi:hypothetical protein